MKILIVGCGSIGKRHAANAAQLAQTAVYDEMAEKAYDVSVSTGTSCFKSLKEALAWKPDGVVVATPHNAHLPVARQAIEANAHVLIEKPLSDSYQGVEEFLDFAFKQQRQVYVVCNMRFHPGPHALKDLLYKIGLPLFARAHVGHYLPSMRAGVDYHDLYASHKDQGGGVILDAIHEIDYLHWLFGDIREVSCIAGKLSGLDIDVEDYAAMHLVHANQTHSEIHLDYLQLFKRRGCEIVGSKGTLLWESGGKTPEYCTVRLFEADNGTWQTLEDIPAVDAAQPYVELMREFVKAISAGGSPLLLDGPTAARELQIALAAHRSSRDRRAIHIS